MKRFLILSRAPFLTAIATSILIGTALASYVNGGINWLIFALAMVGGIFAQAGSNLFNDYYDFKQGADQNNQFRNPFSGGSPSLSAGIDKPEIFFKFGLLSFAITTTCGLILIYLTSIYLIFFGIIGLLLAFIYTAPPFKLVYRGWGEVTIFLTFGPLPVLGAFYVQTGSITTLPVLISIPIGLIITNLLFINQFPDHDSDKAASKNHWVVRLGRQKARWFYLLLGITAFAVTALIPFITTLPLTFLISLGAMIPFLIATKILFQFFNDPPKMVTAQGLTIVSMLLTGILTTIGLMI